ncbi:hypothetical protein BU26DRAFT_551198 [Trematosphaeria pertusa]|uniref:Uncharacterized protein n=1 Tax=Trematosphaeria pertusa TaxID=390896 RepID=A0A6A6IGG8_9PLEO|nr:uncharacterized protein BU26DRAFT_551198 [Trematosphaeria pertusa]KAF2249501.1 hypothetical protein BU26DRAFT_551198 [Trematosphaeria pertusa]
MLLLDSPPEIFQGIVHALVSQAGVSEAWKLRGVCRTFAAEIKHDIFANQPKDAFRDSRSRRVLAEELPLYLSNRTKKLLDAENALPEKVKGMVGNLTNILDVGDQADSQKQHYTETLCKAVLREWGFSAVFAIIGMDGDNDRSLSLGISLQRDLDFEEDIAAFAAIGEHDIVRRLLPRFTQTSESPTFGNPLANAALMGHGNVITVISDYLQRAKKETTSNYAFLLDRFWDGKLAYIINTTIKSGRTDILDQLLAMYKTHHGHPDKSFYNRWLRTAVDSGNAQFVDRILRITIRSKPKVLVKTFEAACELKNADVVAMLLGTSRMHPDQAFLLFSPLAAAIRLGDESVVTTVLDAGANVNGVSFEGKHYPALQVAVDLNEASIVKIMLDRGAILDGIQVPENMVAIRKLFADAQRERELELDYWISYWVMTVQ